MSPAPHPIGDPIGGLPTVDLSPLLAADSTVRERERTAIAIDRACREIGFFGISGHGLARRLFDDLLAASRRFFSLDADEKAEIAMANAGSAWRGWFALGDELTSGRPDDKEGVYFGIEHDADHPRADLPLHGSNLWPTAVPELRQAVTGWCEALRPVADAVLRAMALGSGLDERWFAEHVTADPTVLFRIFHYPPVPADDAAQGWGVGEHTDYGLITLLAQDEVGGLQVCRPDGEWIDVDARPGVLVVNIGDMLERATSGRYRSTPHRVRNRSEHSRFSFPYFFDPSWDATVPLLPLRSETAGNAARPSRWDDGDPTVFEGPYGDYLLSKVAKVFPELFGAATDAPSSEAQ